ncbi:hypothetical protein CVT26_006302 [Gymnopilus dilepis]|uniref:Uncharacterized protein n=1 Tax=Gymnopilus dilepis TaxID=231916 RepID=A0A409Y0U7_9AGAR|nr:hypothetical protein CVT26_006302 [Gymnopilus dilepis]
MSASTASTGSVAGEMVPPTPRKPKTHTTPDIIRLLKSLSLTNILKRNKQIEAENDARDEKTLNHASDPATYPDPGSETASLITIDEADMARLRVPTFYASVKEHIYNTLAARLVDDELVDKEEKKRKGDEMSGLSSEEVRMAKRRCMDGSKHVVRKIGEAIPVEFAQSLYDTELHVGIPLPFFLNKNLRTLIDDGATLPMVKCNPLAGSSKGMYILDIEKLSNRFGKELSLTCSQWTEAAANMWEFQVSRDVDGPGGSHGKWYEDHFNFFGKLSDRDDMYEAWKDMELEFRRDHKSRALAFLPEDYDLAYNLAKASHKLRKEFGEFNARLAPSNRGGSTSFGRPARQVNSQPFPSGSRSTPSSNAVCLLCAERGHSVSYHINITVLRL